MTNGEKAVEVKTQVVQPLLSYIIHQEADHTRQNNVKNTKEYDSSKVKQISGELGH